MLLSDSSGVVTDTWEYDAFGTVIGRTGATPNSLTYSGEWFDSNQGLQYLRARWYDPKGGRFTSMDSVETADGPYSYTGNRPTFAVDPSGHFAALIEAVAVTAIIGVLVNTATVGLGDYMGRHPIGGGEMDITAISNHFETMQGPLALQLAALKENMGTAGDQLLRIANLTFSDSASLITQVEWNARSPIRHLRILDHGDTKGFWLGRERINDDTFKYYEPLFRELRGYFAADGDLTLLGCSVGNNTDLLRRLSAAIGKPVRGGTDVYYSWIRYQSGDYVTCDDEGGVCYTE